MVLVSCLSRGVLWVRGTRLAIPDRAINRDERLGVSRGQLKVIATMRVKIWRISHNSSISWSGMKNET